MNTLLSQLLQWLLQLGPRLLALLRQRRFEREMEEEMRFHLEMQIEQNMEAGMAAEDARYAARRRFGNQTWLKEASREMWSLNSIEILIQDLRYGVRMLMKRPGFSAVAVVTLTLGIGATSAIFSVVECVLLKPLPYSHPDELVSVRFTAKGLGSNIKYTPISPSHYFIFREQSRTFQDIGLYNLITVSVTGLGEPERAPALGVTDSLLPILGVTPSLGRSFTRVDDSPNSADTVILTHGYWSRKLGGDHSVIGRTIEVDGKPHTIIGVLPESFRFLDQTSLAMVLPLKLNREKTYLGFLNFVGVARLKAGVTLEEASAEVAGLLPIVDRIFPPIAGYRGFEVFKLGPNIRPLEQEVVGDVSKVLWVLMGGISLVLIIACANLTNLLLVRAEGRRQELAIRVALGASRSRIALQLLVESLILAFFGGLFGLGLAYWVLRILVALGPQSLPRLHEIGVNGKTVLFTLAVSLAAGLLFGSVPVFKYAGAGIGIGLRASGRVMSESRERHRARSVLVIVQVALALVLLVSSGLMIRTFRALTKVDPGFAAPDEVETFRIAILDAQVKDPERVVRIEEEVLHKIEAIPGVSSASFSRNVPMDGYNGVNPFYSKNRNYDPGEQPFHRYEYVAPDFFKTLGIPLLAGRDFTWSEIYNKYPVAIVSENLAREYWGSPANASGKQFRESPRGDWREVIGVVGNVHHNGVDKDAPATIYWPILISRFLGGSDVVALRDATFVIRSPRARSEGLANEIREAVWSVAPYLPVADVRTLNDNYTRSMGRTSFTLVMLAVAANLALFLGTVGLYGVIAYSVSQRRREIGIRMALGAGKSEVLKLVIGQGMTLSLIGVAIGLAGALGLTRFLSGLLYGVRPGDPVTFVAVSSLLMIVAFFASYLPARHAAKVDPMVALRTE